ncbi:MAG TPA: hypothetical protein VJ346_02990, partial [Bacteroidales bacterium]|nr:hypothetical protein [Bacteroidales bacterium]
VRNWILASNFLKSIMPQSLLKIIDKRMDDKSFKKLARKDKGMSFDLVRASVNLAVSSSLIAFATSYKLPLSTTYVTFMVAMGTSLADRAWGRESAVYRISGVITVIGGWFVTAFVAFTSSLLMAFLIYWGGKYAIAGLIVLAIGFVYKTHLVHRKREKEIKKSEEDFKVDMGLNGKTIQEKCNIRVISSLIAVSKLYDTIINSLIGEKRKKLKNTLKEVKQLNKEVKSFKKNVHETVRTLQEEESIETGDYYVQLLDYLRETAHCMNFIAQPVFEHVDNNHQPLSETQANDLKSFSKSFSVYVDDVIKTISSGKYSEIDRLNNQMQEILTELSKIRKSHLKRIKSDNTGTRVSLLYLDILNETKNLVLYIINLVKTSRDFAEQSKRLVMNPVIP